MLKPILLTISFTLLSDGALAHKAHCEDTKLGAVMSDMKKAHKTLKRAIDDEDFDRIQELSQKLLKLSEESKNHTPLLFKHEDGDLDAFQSKMDELINELTLIQNQAKSKNAEALDSLKKQINRIRKQGHKKFRMDCD